VTSSRRYDVIVVGVGTMGSAAAYHLARRGRRVLALERFDLVHDRGSMHGLTRIIRLAYHEHPDYVPLLRRAYELWRELEGGTGASLLHITGSLEIGPSDGLLVPGTLRACAEHALPYELLDAGVLHERFPMFEPEPDAVGVFQPDGGLLLAEPAVQAHIDAGRDAGAEVRSGEHVLEWSATADGVTVRTDRETYEGGRLVLCPGAWAAGLLRLPPELFVVERQVVAWFEPQRRDLFTPERLPVFILEQGDVHHYGFPRIDGSGVKLGRMHHPGQTVPDPDALERAPSDAEVEVLSAFLAARLPQAAGPVLAAQACMFTSTPDRRFVIDLHPDEPNVVFASVCSGHGFKFAPVVGEILADLALEGSTRHPIGFLRFDRLAGRRAA
jgi:sarcosine oxidase